MKMSPCRIATLLALAALTPCFVSGCQSDRAGDKPGDEMNSAMTAQQKAVITEHKKKADQ